MRGMYYAAAIGTLMAGTALVPFTASANDLFVEQVGASNFADANQTGLGNETYVLQTGDRSSAGAGFRGNNNDGLIRQETNNNRADWSFETDTSGPGLNGNTFGIVQKGGHGNFAGINTQGAPSNSTVFIEQDGHGNAVGGGNDYSTSVGNGHTTSASISVSGVSSGIGPADSGIFDPVNSGSNLAKVSGNGHYIGLRQIGNSNVVGMNVSGSNNTIGGPNTTHNGATLNNFTHVAFFDSPESLAPSAGGVNGMGIQQGFGNEAALVQAGVNNAINFGQIGNNQVAEVYQSGSGNLASAVQTQ